MGSVGSTRNPTYLLAGNDSSVSNPNELEELSNSQVKARNNVVQSSINNIDSYQLSEHSVIDIDEQINLDIKVHETRTIWHSLLSRSRANYILREAQSKRGVTIGVFLVLAYCVGLFTFDTDLLGWFGIIYSCFILLLAVPGVVLYFGTLNRQICIAVLKNFNFWYKMYNVLLSNIMEVIWAWNNVEFIRISRATWFTIYGFYFFVNIVATSMGCLLDGFKWKKALRISGPLLLSGYFLWGAIYWHFLNTDGTIIRIALFGPFKKDFLLSYIAANADINASIFFFWQGICALFWEDQASVLEATVTINWDK